MIWAFGDKTKRGGGRAKKDVSVPQRHILRLQTRLGRERPPTGMGRRTHLCTSYLRKLELRFGMSVDCLEPGGWSIRWGEEGKVTDKMRLEIRQDIGL